MGKHSRRVIDIFDNDMQHPELHKKRSNVDGDNHHPQITKRWS